MRRCICTFACLFTYLATAADPLLADATSKSAFRTPRISAISFFDTGELPSGTGEPYIDTIRGTCDADDPTPEPFHDTLVAITVVNPGTSNLIVSSYTFSMNRGSGASTFRSKDLGFTGALEIPPGETATLYGLAFRAGSTTKLYPRTSTSIGEPGFRTIRFTLRGRIGTRSLSISGTSGASFSNYDRCD